MLIMLTCEVDDENGLADALVDIVVQETIDIVPTNEDWRAEIERFEDLD